MARYVDLDKIIDHLLDEWGYEGMREELYDDLQIPVADVVERPKWISVNDALPTVYDEETWVMLEDGKIDTDTWQADRGEPGHWANGPEDTRKFIHSGWYTWCGANIIKWAPLVMPEPKEDA